VHAFLRLEEIETDISEGGGAFCGNTIGGEGLKEVAQDVVDVNLSEEIAGGRGEFFGEIGLAGVGELGGIFG